VTHSYPVAGDYEPTVTVVDASNRTDEATATLSIESRSLSASLNVPDSPAVNESVTLDASGSAPAELITEYRWDFEGDGTVDLTTSGPTAEHVYAAPGTYDPTVTVVNASNGTASASTSVTVGSVDQPPSAALNAPATASINESVTLDASGSTDDVGITEYRWDFEGTERSTRLRRPRPWPTPTRSRNVRADRDGRRQQREDGIRHRYTHRRIGR